jgi:hypothetical protein
MRGYYLEPISCRLAIQVCIGYFPDGRERHRTFSIPNVRRDATADALAAVVRAIAPLLAYPVTKVRLVTRDRLVTKDASPVARPKETAPPDGESTASTEPRAALVPRQEPGYRESKPPASCIAPP